MQPTTQQGDRASLLPVILTTAVVQGWALYGLHHAIMQVHWPATNAAWLVALYAVALFVPLTVQMLAIYARTPVHAVIVAILGMAFFYFGWHYGGSVLDGSARDFIRRGEFFPIGFVVGVLWLLSMPFVQARLQAGQWTVEYQTWFALAWRNKLTLAEAGLFTGLFWLLLLLWQELFHMLGINFFRDLFREEIFVYPVTSVAFGVALHLIGSIERLTQAILEQLLNVLKWLAVVAGLILALFTLALALQLPGMIASGQRAIGAAWLLWLVAVMVLLLNAAYRDGSVEQPYPRWIALALRCVVPFTVVVALTAIYALTVRVQHYGLTVGRVWGFVVAGMALIYSLGYALAALHKGHWLKGMARVNVIAALALIAALVVALTPVLSPYRLASDSQFRLAQKPDGGGDTRGDQKSHMQALRFETGKYGRERLEQLAALQGDGELGRIREMAAAALTCENHWQCEPVRTKAALEALVAGLKVFPPGMTIDGELAGSLLADLRESAAEFPMASEKDSVGVFADLDGEGTDEFAFATVRNGLLYARIDNKWTLVAKAHDRGAAYAYRRDFQDIDKTQISVVQQKWRGLRIGTKEYEFKEIEK